MKYIKSSKINRLILGIITFSLVFSFSFAPIKKANAWLGIADVPIDAATNILSFAERVWTAYLESESWWKEWILDPIIYVIAQELLSDITESTVNWINSGFEGGPLYDVNFADSVKNGLNEASGILIDEMGGADICSNLKEGLGFSFEYESTYEIKMKCTLNDAIDNVTDFYNDFTTGGWKGWVTLSVSPQNNPYGAYITSADEYAKMRSEKAKEVQSEIDSGGGFKSFKKCDEYSKDASGADTTSCKHWTIQTPGKTIESRLTTATGVDFGALQMADEMDEIIGALLQQAMSAIFEEGSSEGGGGLTGASETISQDQVPATIDEEMGVLKTNLQIYYDYFTETSNELPNGLHYEMRQTIMDQYIYEENYWRLAQYCKNGGTTEANGIEGTTYLKEIIEATEDEIKAQKAASTDVIQENINSANGLYSEGFKDSDGNRYEGVYNPLYVNSDWKNVTSKTLSAWKTKLTELQGIQRYDTSKLKQSKDGKDSAKDAYEDKCCDVDTATALFCAINPFCQVCSIGISILGGDFNIIDLCGQLCPCEGDTCNYKTGDPYKSCAEGLGGTVCSRNDTCEGGEMRPTINNAFCCVNGTCTPRGGAGTDIYGIIPDPSSEDEQRKVAPNGCAKDMQECSSSIECCDKWKNICGHKTTDTKDYCYPIGTEGLVGRETKYDCDFAQGVGTNGQDQLNINEVSIIGMSNGDVKNWSITSPLNYLNIDGTKINFYTQRMVSDPGMWKNNSEGANGNPWVFANINGRWYGGTWEWLREGTTQKQIATQEIGTYTKASPMKEWSPKVGEDVGFMISALARGGRTSVPERTNIVMLKWPECTKIETSPPTTYAHGMGCASGPCSERPDICSGRSPACTDNCGDSACAPYFGTSDYCCVPY